LKVNNNNSSLFFSFLSSFFFIFFISISQHKKLFDVLREQNPKALDKLIAIRGNVEALGIGLTPESNEQLKDVSVIFHSAASVRFDDTLQYAIILNTRGTREVVEFALKLKRLAAFVHVSTTYCYPERSILEEKVRTN
jgi:alcohol-forming fatty acyl-CoA reductase